MRGSMKKPKGKIINGKFRVYRPSARELEIAAAMQAPIKKGPDATAPGPNDTDNLAD
jgi:hypothetical protein